MRPSITLVPASIALVLSAAAPRARAQEVPCDAVGDLPCTYQVRALQVQKATPVLKFQARIAQAGLPLGEATFSTVFVKLLRGVETICLEQLADVRVVDSVMNLEIGRDLSCPLDEALAENNDLALQICPGGIENCLKPTSLGTSPYAIKASYTSLAQEADAADVAGQASYAHRAAADRDMLVRGAIGTGYFDFATPTADEAEGLYSDPDDFMAYASAGFVAWAPTRDPSAQRVHVAGKDQASDRLVELASLVLAAERTTVTGDLTVTPPADGQGLTVTARGLHALGDSAVAGALAVTRALTVASEGARVTGDSAIVGALDVTQQVTIGAGGAGGAHVTGASTIGGELGVSQLLRVLDGGLRVTGATTLDGTLLVHDAMTARAGLTVTGASDVAGRVAVADGVAIAGGGLRVDAGGATVAGGLVVGGGGLETSGDARVAGRLATSDAEVSGSVYAVDGLGAPQRFFAISGQALAINPDQTLAGTEIAGQMRFSDLVTFEGGTTDPRQGESFIFAAGEVRDLTLAGALTVLGALRLTGGVTGGLTVSGGMTVRGGLALPDGVAGDLAAHGALTVGGAGALAGPVALPGGVSGTLTASGALRGGADLTLSGAATLSGPTTLAGGVSGRPTFTGAIGVGAAGGLVVQGATTLAGLAVSGPVLANGAARFDGAVTLAGGVSGHTTLANNLVVSGATTLSGATTVSGALTVDGLARLLGSVNFGGTFTGTTAFQNVAAAGTLSVDGLSVFNGAVSFPGGITGSVSLETAEIGATLSVAGATVFDGPVDFRGVVTGVGGLTAYVRASGETRGLTLPSLVVAGDTSIGGTLATTAGFTDLEIVGGIDNTADLAVEGALTVAGDASFGGDLRVEGDLMARTCRLCLNYADGSDVDKRRHACIRWENGADSSMLHLLGDVDDNDVVGLKFKCDDGPSGFGFGWQ